MINSFDILIVGAGHAGIEAANISSQFSGLKVGLLTKKGVPIGSTPCNPAIGGVGKGQLVREIDILGGAIGALADKAAIQCRILNDSKGDAVKSTRFQVDKRSYSQAATDLILENSNLTVEYGELVNCERDQESEFFRVFLKSGDFLLARRLVVTVGTFFDGVLHEGFNITPGGRIGCDRSVPVAALGLNVRTLSKKFKTGTPPRIKKDTVDTSKMEVQESDPRAQNFGFLSDPFQRFLRQVPCYKTHTNSSTVEIVLNNKESSPMFNGQISGVGPRYCPSIEDKAFKYPEKFDHHVFIEPEGLDLDTFYPNGVSTSLPSSIQEEMIRTISGMENAEVSIPGYAVEYDVIDTSRLSTSLESVDCRGLYFAGQVNGTSGYEEAAGQGLVAGLNAALASLSREEVVFPRGTSYIGVLIDDILSNKREEPYRLFTARAENRLYIREDNSVSRLGKIRLSLGLNSKLDRKIKKHLNELSVIDKVYSLLPSSLQNEFAAKSSAVEPSRFINYMKNMHGINLSHRASQEFLISKKYEGYINRQKISNERFGKMDKKRINVRKITEDLPISNECRELIIKYNPTTFFHLKSIRGIRPATLALVSSQL
tara:strand:- start:18064 stop:19863 length:1800 start_codon:yes stop_codon:yes gene_type:complete